MLIHHLGNRVSPTNSLQQQPFLIIMGPFTTSVASINPTRLLANLCFSSSQLALSLSKGRRGLCNAKRRVRYDEEEEEEYGHNEDILMLELYSQSARDEALLVKAEVDAQEVEVLIFKGFSSSLSYGTSPDPSKSILPARAVIKSIDRVKGLLTPLM